MSKYSHIFVALLLGLTVSGCHSCFGADISNDERRIEKPFSTHEFQRFSKENPEAALNIIKWCFKVDRSHELKFIVEKTFREWAHKDIGSATAWLDRQIAANFFDPQWLGRKNATYYREALESQAVIHLMDSNLAAAKARLDGMNELMRAELLRGSIYWDIPDHKQAAQAQLIRDYLDDNARLDIFAKVGASGGAFGNFTKVDSYLNRIELLPDERQRIIKSAAADSISFIPWRAKKIASQDIEAMRAWLVSKGFISSVDRLTGENIAGAVFPKDNIYFSEARALCINFSEACGLVMEFWTLTGNEDVLIGFLERSKPWEDIDKAIALSGKISDLKKRDELIKKFQPQQ